MFATFSQKLHQLLNIVVAQYNKTQLEAFLVSISYLLFIFSWLLYLQLIPSGILSIIMMTALPFIALFLPKIRAYVMRYFSRDKENNPENTFSSAIDIEKDSVNNACAKFMLHSCIYITMIYCTLKTLGMIYGLNYIGIYSMAITVIVALLILPIIAKQTTALATVLKRAANNHTAKENNALDIKIFFKSLLIAALASTGVFTIMLVSTMYLPILLPAVYLPLLFITTLVTLDTLIVVSYLYYMRFKYNDEEVNWSRMKRNSFNFITSTFGLLLSIFQLSVSTHMFPAYSFTLTTIFSSVMFAGLYMFFPTLLIFGLGVTGILINNTVIPTHSSSHCENPANTNETTATETRHQTLLLNP